MNWKDRKTFVEWALACDWRCTREIVTFTRDQIGEAHADRCVCNEYVARVLRGQDGSKWSKRSQAPVADPDT
jgi:hypothetical protein